MLRMLIVKDSSYEDSKSPVLFLTHCLNFYLDLISLIFPGARLYSGKKTISLIEDVLRIRLYD